LIATTGNGRNPIVNGRRQPSCDGTSRMNREVHVQIYERLGVKCSGPTRQTAKNSRKTLTSELPPITDMVRPRGNALRLPSAAKLDRNVDVGDWDGLALHHDRTIGPARTCESSTRLRNSLILPPRAPVHRVAPSLLSDHACRNPPQTTRKPEPTVHALPAPCPGCAGGVRGSL